MPTKGDRFIVGIRWDVQIYKLQRKKKFHDFVWSYKASHKPPYLTEVLNAIYVLIGERQKEKTIWKKDIHFWKSVLSLKSGKYYSVFEYGNRSNSEW